MLPRCRTCYEDRRGLAACHPAHALVAGTAPSVCARLLIETQKGIPEDREPKTATRRTDRNAFISRDLMKSNSEPLEKNVISAARPASDRLSKIYAVIGVSRLPRFPMLQLTATRNCAIGVGTADQRYVDAARTDAGVVKVRRSVSAEHHHLVAVALEQLEVAIAPKSAWVSLGSVVTDAHVKRPVLVKSDLKPMRQMS